MNFKTWIIRRHIDDDSPIGDLARDIKDDETFTEKNSFSGIDNYLDMNNACDRCIEAFKKAWDEYTKWQKKKIRTKTRS